jgi:hypothetical protein
VDGDDPSTRVWMLVEVPGVGTQRRSLGTIPGHCVLRPGGRRSAVLGSVRCTFVDPAPVLYVIARGDAIVVRQQDPESLVGPAPARTIARVEIPPGAVIAPSWSP